jgi:dolichyl-phosphate-mannose--protein O-mannosyl transferase
MLVQLLLVSAVVMGLSHTIAKERIFDPLRRKAGGIATWRGYLVACPYCASHWLAFVLVPLTGTYLIHIVPRIPVLSAVLDWFLSSILVTVVAAFLRVGFYLVDEGQRLTRRRLVDETHDHQPPLVQ